MKLRIKGSSLRLRLTQSEVQALQTTGQLTEEVHFGSGVTLRYRLSSDRIMADITATYENNLIDIRVPESQVLSWCRSTEVTLGGTQTSPDAQLRLSIEKDFACLAPRDNEDESDNFPHPGAQSGQTC